MIVAGARYGMGPSRDRAAKGASLQGARADLAVSFERIHRSNLIGMGILPMRLPEGVGPEELALTAGDILEIHANADLISPRCPIDVVVKRSGGQSTTIEVVDAIETAAEVEILKAGGILSLMLANLIGSRLSGG